MVVFHQLFIIFVIFASGTHGNDAVCNFAKHLDKHYLQAAYLDGNGALYFNGTKIAEIKKNFIDGDRIVMDAHRIFAVEAVRIDVKKFALLGYTVHSKMTRISVVGYEDNEWKEYLNHDYLQDNSSHGLPVVNANNMVQAYYDKDENVIYVDETHKIFVENGTLTSGQGDERCFEKNMNINCVYDPYTQKLKIDDGSSHEHIEKNHHQNIPEYRRMILQTSSCNIDVILGKTNKHFLSNGICLATSEYQKIFLFPDFTMYDRNGCDNTVILTKPEEPTTTTIATTKVPLERAFAEQLNKHYLEVAYLNQGGALYFKGLKIAQIKRSYQIKEFDAVRIDVKKFALFGYSRTHQDNSMMAICLVVGYEDNEWKEYYYHKYDNGVRMERTMNRIQSYYNKDENAIYVNKNYKVLIENGTIASGQGDERCFVDRVHCIYDPYAQKLKIVSLSSSQSQLFSTSSCNLVAALYKSDKGELSYFVSDGKENGSKFSLTPPHDFDLFKIYLKIFLLPDFSKYDRNDCDNTVILTRSNATTTIETSTTTTAPVFKSTSQSNTVYNAGGLGSNYEECTQEQRNMWYGAAAAFIIALLIFVAGISATIVIVRKGKAKKKEYMAKKNNAFANTPKAEVPTMSPAQQDDGRSPLPSATPSQIE